MNEVKADHIHKFAAVVGRKMPAATQYRRLKRFRFAKMGIYQKDKRSYSMRGASIIIETTDEKQSSVVQRFDSSDSTMHVIYMFRWPSPPKCRTDNKMRNKNNRRNYNKHEEERRNTHEKLSLSSVRLLYTSHVITRAAAMTAATPISVSLSVSRGHRGACFTCVTDFMIHYTSAAAAAQWLSSAARLRCDELQCGDGEATRNSKKCKLAE